MPSNEPSAVPNAVVSTENDGAPPVTFAAAPPSTRSPTPVVPATKWPAAYTYPLSAPSTLPTTRATYVWPGRRWKTGTSRRCRSSTASARARSAGRWRAPGRRLAGAPRSGAGAAPAARSRCPRRARRGRRAGVVAGGAAGRVVGRVVGVVGVGPPTSCAAVHSLADGSPPGGTRSRARAAGPRATPSRRAARDARELHAALRLAAVEAEARHRRLGRRPPSSTARARRRRPPSARARAARRRGRGWAVGGGGGSVGAGVGAGGVRPA